MGRAGLRNAVALHHLQGRCKRPLRLIQLIPPSAIARVQLNTSQTGHLQAAPLWQGNAAAASQRRTIQRQAPLLPRLVGDGKGKGPQLLRLRRQGQGVAGGLDPLHRSLVGTMLHLRLQRCDLLHDTAGLLQRLLQGAALVCGLLQTRGPLHLRQPRFQHLCLGLGRRQNLLRLLCLGMGRIQNFGNLFQGLRRRAQGLLCLGTVFAARQKPGQGAVVIVQHQGGGAQRLLRDGQFFLILLSGLQLLLGLAQTRLQRLLCFGVLQIRQRAAQILTLVKLPAQLPHLVGELLFARC